MNKDYYEILGVSRDSSVEDVRKSFKRLARKYHPDMNKGDKKAEERFKEISEAYDVLSDPKKKKNYDAYGHANFESAPRGGQYSYTTTQSPDFDLGDIFGDIFGGAAAGRGGRPRRRQQGFGFDPTHQPARGRDLHFSVDLDFLDAAKGCEKTIRLSNGAKFKVKIPSGIADASKIRLASKGEPGLYGGEAGDLYIEPHVKTHPYFRRSGDDIELDVPITLTEALEGARVRVPTLDGSVQLTIPPNAQSGQKLRLGGKGIFNTKTKSTGDQYVILQIQIPKTLDAKTKKELLKIIGHLESDPRAHFE